MPYIGTQPKDVRSFGKAQFDFTATQGQTAFTGADDDGKTLGFTEGQIQVYVNGILMDASDYTTSNANTVTLVSAANLNDIITVVALQTDIPNSDYVPISGGTFTGDVTFSGSINGDVGIGTSSPAATLEISDATSNAAKLRIARSNTQTNFLELGTSGGDSTLTAQGIAGVSGDFAFLAKPSDGSAVERMRIDGAGYVTMPYQPWALVDMGGGSSYVGSSGVIAFDNVAQSNGSHYNTSTYRFVCPVAGVYSIAWSILSDSNSDAYGVEPRVNGTRVARSYVVYRGNRGYIEYKCAANDYLDIQTNVSENVYPDTGTERYTWACYRLLG